MRFEFATAGRILFGAPVAELRSIVPPLGRRVLLITPARVAPCIDIESIFDGTGVAIVHMTVAGEPTIAEVDAGRGWARAEGCDAVLAIGGGSVLDAGKAIAMLATNLGAMHDYLEVIGEGRAMELPGLPCVAVPTTAGTGAEVTRNAVLTAPAQQVKVSLRSPMMLPRVALIDPTLTRRLPPPITAATGMDALTQLIEPFVSARRNPMTDGLCREGIARVAWALPRAFHNGEDSEAREAMALASLFGGLALANAGLGAVHGFAAPIGGRFPAPHGAICAALLPHVMAANIAAARADGQADILVRYAEVARLLTGEAHARPDDGVARVRALRDELGIPGLGIYGIEDEDAPTIVAQAMRASSMQANPVRLDEATLIAALLAAL